MDDIAANDTVLLRFESISKSFYGIQALTNVGFNVRTGEVHALLGENGAGKSTLLNILMGVFPPDNGSIFINGQKTEIKSPASAKKLGINKVHQELQLVPELTVGQNILLGNEPTYGRLGLINWSELHRQATEALDLLDADFSSRELTKNLSTAQMQLVEIAKALKGESRILALDEPTSSLTTVEIDKLFEVIHRLKQTGTAIIYVSHRLDEVFQIADLLTVLRDGKNMGTYPVADMDKPRLIKLMVGRELQDAMKLANGNQNGDITLEVKNLIVGNNKTEINFHVKKGEILGISGLVGSGRTELMRTIFGADRMRGGEIFVKGKKVNIKSPAEAIRLGLALIPQDRKQHGFVPILSNRSNICLSSLREVMNWGLLSRNSMNKKSSRVIERLRINPADPEKLTRDLSGGNQQKVVLAKWLSKQCDIMIFDEPTRGIDVGAKSEIYILMRELASQGLSIIMVSSELPEILGMSDRILVMHEGSIKGELLPDEATEEKILQIAMGAS